MIKMSFSILVLLTCIQSHVLDVDFNIFNFILNGLFLMFGHITAIKY